MKRTVSLALFLLLFAGAAAAVYVDVFEPVMERLSPDQTISLGKAGPGQTVVIVMDRATEQNPEYPTCDNTGGVCAQGWDTVVPVESSIPDASWVVEASPLHEQPMKVKIKVSPYAGEGTYNLDFTAVDEGDYDGLGTMTFHVEVIVTKDVFSIDAQPAAIATGVGQPAVYYVNITNTGSASDPFEIRVKEGTLPAHGAFRLFASANQGEGDWRFRKQVLVNYQSERVVPYEVVLDEEGTRVFTLQVTSLSSPLISKEIPLTITAEPSIINDWKATTHGLMMFPMVLEPAYAIMGLLGNLLPA
ncbi:MAG: hypothetical protein PHF51_03915 [Candidatus ainarchaeum sp.]|nr:hypothetical protein [Candidatus ainarchaeum sp.]